jgi:hypothetical protein
MNNMASEEGEVLSKKESSISLIDPTLAAKKWSKEKATVERPV